MELKNHDLVSSSERPGVLYQEVPLVDPEGAEVPGLHTVRITLDNPSQFNSYTTDMVKGVILGMRRASNDRAAVAVVFTGSGDRAFCTGGNTQEYAEYYAGRPEEYRQYMRLFNDMVSAILMCDKPVICRVNGMRIAGGQEIGMACDFSVAQDLAVFGQAGPKHGSAPDGGSTDFLPLFVGIEQAMESCTLCDHWSAHKAYRLGLVSQVVPGLRDRRSFRRQPHGRRLIAGSTTRVESSTASRARERTVSKRRRSLKRGKVISRSAGCGGGRSRVPAGDDHAWMPHRRRSRASASTSSSTGTATRSRTAPGSRST